eukprot:TRINITY_DN1851_c0_g1_i1.p1 TRINITY_DN1851_c0_g1~~TRINITY_DN1851_c0_g1_i1.p1  ORF type:complete len:162 (+),score=11.60 TRINITY_DN1851_c0_g1_i1:57-488(+)
MTDNRSNNSWAGPDESGHSFDNSVTLESLRNALKSFARERDWEQYHTPRNLALALVGEVGELCEIFQWRADAELSPGLPGWSPADKEHLGEELSDVLLYLIRLADRCQIDLAKAATSKIQKNASKYPSHKAKGSRDKYTQFAN